MLDYDLLFGGYPSCPRLFGARGHAPPYGQRITRWGATYVLVLSKNCPTFLGAVFSRAPALARSSPAGCLPARLPRWSLGTGTGRSGL